MRIDPIIIKNAGLPFIIEGIIPLIPLQFIPFQNWVITNPVKNAVACSAGEKNGRPTIIAAIPMITYIIAVQRMALFMYGVITEAVRGIGFRFISAGWGDSEHKARAARESMIMLIQSN